MVGKSNPSVLSESSLVVNCSILMQDRSLAERLTAVAATGIGAVEFWWPFTTATPSDAEVERFIDLIRDSGLRLVGMNLFAGDLAAGDRGTLSWPGREAEFLASAEVSRRIGEALGVRRFTALYGNRIEGVDPGEQDALAAENVRRIAPILEPIDGIILFEPVSGVPAYPLKTADETAAAIDRVREDSGVDRLGMLFDLYHLASNGDDVPAAIRAHGRRAVHLQVADSPGRGAPGTGKLPLIEWVQDLRALGYRGAVAFEYVSTAPDPFAGLDIERWAALAGSGVGSAD